MNTPISKEAYLSFYFAYLMVSDLADRAGIDPDQLIEKYNIHQVPDIGKTSAAEVLRQSLERVNQL